MSDNKDLKLTIIGNASVGAGVAREAEVQAAVKAAVEAEREEILKIIEDCYLTPAEFEAKHSVVLRRSDTALDAIKKVVRARSK